MSWLATLQTVYWSMLMCKILYLSYFVDSVLCLKVMKIWLWKPAAAQLFWWKKISWIILEIFYLYGSVWPFFYSTWKRTISRIATIIRDQLVTTFVHLNQNLWKSTINYLMLFQRLVIDLSLHLNKGKMKYLWSRTIL